MIKNICMYCSISDAVDAAYVAAAEALGAQIGSGGHTLVYGGGAVGLMGTLARAVHRANGRVVGVIPEGWTSVDGAAYEAADQLVATRTLQKRRAVMFSRADAFVVLPGGFGTLEEFLEVLALKQHGKLPKPLVLVNTRAFYDPLLAFFDRFVQESFAHEDKKTLYHVASTPAAAMTFLNA